MQHNTELPTRPPRASLWVPAGLGDLLASLLIATLSVCATAAFLVLYARAEAAAHHSGGTAAVAAAAVGQPAPGVTTPQLPRSRHGE